MKSILIGSKIQLNTGKVLTVTDMRIDLYNDLGNLATGLFLNVAGMLESGLHTWISFDAIKPVIRGIN